MIPVTIIHHEEEVTAVFDPIHKRVTIRRGSKLSIDLENNHSHPQSNFNCARKLVRNGSLATTPDGNILQQDITVSPSAGKVLVTGSAGSGWTAWVVAEQGHLHYDQPIDVFRQENLENQPEGFVNPEQNLQRQLLSVDSISELGTALGQADQDFYKILFNSFAEKNRVQVVHGEQCANLAFPRGIGVYVVRRCLQEHLRNQNALATPDSSQILYIGLAGRIQRNDHGDGYSVGGGGLQSRLNRWHPYCFTTQGPFANYFEYGPNAGVNQLLRTDAEHRYRVHIPIGEIAVDCFRLEGAERNCSPAFLEGLLLQCFLTAHGRLPNGNNRF